MARKVRKDEGYTVVEPRYSYSYDVSQYGHPYSRPKHRLTSPTEIRDIAAAIAILTVAFFIFTGSSGHGVTFDITAAALVVVAGFFIHEMSHKVVARRYGCWAEFRADYRMLGLAVVTAFFGFLWAAPGAVWIAGNIGSRENGKISLAGPGSNMLIGLVCLPFVFIVPGIPDLGIAIAAKLYFFSIFLGAFNMIPFMPFDGAKIWHWSKAVYIATLLAAGLMLFAAFYWVGPFMF